MHKLNRKEIAPEKYKAGGEFSFSLINVKKIGLEAMRMRLQLIRIFTALFCISFLEYFKPVHQET